MLHVTPNALSPDADDFSAARARTVTTREHQSNPGVRSTGVCRRAQTMINEDGCECPAVMPGAIHGDAASPHQLSRSHSRRPPPLDSSTGQPLCADTASHQGYAGGAQPLLPTNAVDHGA